MTKKMKGDIVNTAVSFVLAIGISGLTLGAVVLAVGAFLNGAGQPTANSTYAFNQTNFTLGNVTTGMVNFASQFGNMGTMAGVAILLLFVFAAIGVVGYGIINRGE